MISNNQQFITTDRVIRIIGENGKPELYSVRADDVKGNYDLIVEAGATQAMNKQIKRNEAVQLNQQLLPYIQMGVINPEWSAKQLLDAYDVKNADEALKPAMGQFGAQNTPPQAPNQPPPPQMGTLGFAGNPMSPEQAQAMQAAQNLGISLPHLK